MFKKIFFIFIVLFIFLLEYSFSIIRVDFIISFLYFFFFFIIFTFLRNYSFKKILPVITGSVSLIIFIYGIVQKYILFPIYLNIFSSGLESLPNAYIERIKTGRIFSIFTLPTQYSFICSILIILIFHYLINSRGVKRVFWTILLLAGFFNLVLSGSFSSVLYIFVGFTMYFYFSGFLKKEYIAPFLMILSLLVFIITGTRFSEAKKLEPIKLRLSNWSQAVRIIKEYPSFGVGMGNYANVIPMYIKSGEARSIYAHNFPLQFIAENGIFVSIFLILILLLNLKKLYSITSESKKIFLPLFSIFILYNLIDIGLYFFSSAIVGVIILSQMYRKENAHNKLVGSVMVIVSILYILISFSSSYTRDGNLLMSQKKYNESFNMYKKSMFLNKFNYKNFNGLATLYLIKKKYEKAEKTIGTSLKYNFESGYSHYVKSKICQINKKYFSALWHSLMAVHFNRENGMYRKWSLYMKSELSRFLKDDFTDKKEKY